MTNLLAGEFFKLRKSVPFRLLILAMTTLSALTAFSSLSFSAAAAAAREIPLTGYEAFFISLRDTPTLSFLGIIVTAILLCGDFDSRTIQAQIACGHGRGEILCSKLISFAAAFAAVLLPYPLTRAILQGVFHSFGAPLSPQTFLQMAGYFLTVLLISLALLSVSFLLAFAIRKTAPVVGLSIVVLILGGNVLLSFGNAYPWLGRVLAATPLGLGKALAATARDISALAPAAGLALVYLAPVLLLTYFIFRRAELK